MQRATVISSFALLALVLAACGGESDASDGVNDLRGRTTAGATPRPTSTLGTPSPTRTATPGTPSPAPTTTGRALAPERAIAVGSETGALIEVEIPTGRVIGELDADLGDVGVGEGAGSLDYSPDRGSVTFSRVITAASQEVVEVLLDSGQARVVANGHTAAMWPDGERIAVGRRELGEQGPDQVVLEIRTPDGQLLRRWTDPAAAEEPIRISHLTWSPDRTRLAFELGFEDGTEVRTLDVTADEGSLQAASRKLESPGDLRMLSVPEFDPDGALVAVDGPGLDPDAEQRWRIVALDASSSEVTAVLVETDRAVTVLDFDDSGQHLLYVEGHAHPHSSQDAHSAPVLFHWQDGTSAEVARNLRNATW